MKFSIVTIDDLHKAHIHAKPMSYDKARNMEVNKTVKGKKKKKMEEAMKCSIVTLDDLAKSRKVGRVTPKGEGTATEVFTRPLRKKKGPGKQHIRGGGSGTPANVKKDTSKKMPTGKAAKAPGGPLTRSVSSLDDLCKGAGGDPFKHKTGKTPKAPPQKHYMGDKHGEEMTDVHPDPRHSFKKYGKNTREPVEESKGMKKRVLKTKPAQGSTGASNSDVVDSMVQGEIGRITSVGSGPKLGSLDIGYFVMGNKEEGRRMAYVGDTMQAAIHAAGQGDQSKLMDVSPVVGGTTTVAEKLGKVFAPLAPKGWTMESAKSSGYQWIGGKKEKQGTTKSFALGPTLFGGMVEDDKIAEEIQNEDIRKSGLTLEWLKNHSELNKGPVATDKSGRTKLKDEEAIKYLNLCIRKCAREMMVKFTAAGTQMDCTGGDYRGQNVLEGQSEISKNEYEQKMKAKSKPFKIDLDKLAESVHDKLIDCAYGDSFYSASRVLVQGMRAVKFDIGYVQNVIDTMGLEDDAVVTTKDSRLVRHEVLG